MKILGWLITLTMIYSHCMCYDKNSARRRIVRATRQQRTIMICTTYEDTCICEEVNLNVKRSVRENTVEIIGDACYFHTYDSDGNGEITKTELAAIFKRDDLSKRLFQGINNNKEDDVITFNEFYETAPQYIHGCWKDDKKD